MMENKILLLKTSILLIAVRTALSLLPFATVRRGIDWLARTFSGHQGMSVYSQQRVIWAVTTAGEKLLGDKPCLTQALAVQLLFKRRGIASSLRIGVIKNEQGQLLAHAWVEKEGRILIGGSDSSTRYTPLPLLD